MKRITIIFLLLIATGLCIAQWHIDEGFEGISTLPAGWTFHDDGDGMTWRNYNNANYAHSGTRAALADNYLPNQNADWLVTPQVSIAAGDSLIFFTRSWISTESLKVFASTTGNQPANLTTQLAHIQNIGNSYQAVRISLNQYAGQSIYLGFFWQCNTYGILIDDVKIGQNINITPELNLPDQISFFQGESLTMDFTPYVVCTDLQTASLSVSPTAPISVSITGMLVTFSSADYAGTQDLSFTLTDGSNGLTATDIINVIVNPTPAVDLAIVSVISPRIREFLGMSFTPRIEIANYGTSTLNDQIELAWVLFDAQGSQISQDTAFLTALINPGQSMTATFPNPVNITTEGAYTFHFSIISPDANMANNALTFVTTVVLRITTGGPDAFGYRYVDSNDPLGPEYDWIDISATGTSTIMFNVPTWFGDDNFSEPIPLGFSFPFYGSQYSTAYVDINGEILLAPNNWYTAYPSQGWGSDGNMFNYMYPIPGYAQMPAMIAAYWDDLYAEQGVGDIYFQSFGESPNRYTVIQWHNLRYLAGSGGASVLKFQIILHEDGEILMQYHTTATGQSGSVVPHNNGLSATVAIQNQAANAGLTYLREIVQNNTYIGVEPAGNLLHDNLAIRFYSGSDEQAPIITHKAVGNTFQQDMDLIATIIDMSTLSSNNLHYNHGAGWQSVSATPGDANQYSYTLTNLPLGSTLQYYFQAEDVEGNIGRLPAGNGYYSFKILPTASANVLIAYSGTQDYQRIELPIYEGILTDMGIGYDIYNWEEYPQYAFPDQYAAILTYANTGSQGEKANTLSIALMNWLDLGTLQSPKNLWFSSDGWANNQHAHPNSSPMRRLMSGYFRTSYVPTGFGGGTNGLGGPNSFTYEHGTILCLPGSQVGTPGTEYAVYANSPDCIFPNNAAGDPYWDEVPYPEIGANYVFAFEDGPFNGQAYLYHGVCATTVDTPSYRTMYFSFDFSQLTSAAARTEWMEDLFDWYGIGPVDNSDPAIPTVVTGIDRVFPNPFNPRTTISFNLPGIEDVSLAVYNIKGQKVKQLVQETRLAGNHRVIWDGTDLSGKTVASGVYYIKLDTASLTQTRKITLIK
ncbi:MAG: choice-of-anchor J domain-containing protein [Candidatus Cloacimonadaceae bacterium]|nr:choice-of-anchor J domain-containing protein [Candidatus Cloacimonadaceae bacterium]